MPEALHQRTRTRNILALCDVFAHNKEPRRGMHYIVMPTSNRPEFLGEAGQVAAADGLRQRWCHATSADYARLLSLLKAPPNILPPKIQLKFWRASGAVRAAHLLSKGVSVCESPERSCAAEEPARFEQACFPLSQLGASACQWASEWLVGPTHALPK